MDLGHLRCAVCNRICEDNYIRYEMEDDVEIGCDRSMELPEGTIRKKIGGYRKGGAKRR